MRFGSVQVSRSPDDRWCQSRLLSCLQARLTPGGTGTALSVRFRSLLVLGEPADTTTIDFDTSDHPDFHEQAESQVGLTL